jgi:hypothetical protein
MAKVKEQNAYFDIGVVPIKNNLNKAVAIQKYIVLPKRFAIFLKIPVVTTPPAPRTITITKGRLAGRTRQVEFSGKVSGIKYELGYYNGTKAATAKEKAAIKIKWIPIHIPRGLSTKEFLKVVTAKVTRKPQFLKMPSGKSVRLNEV